MKAGDRFEHEVQQEFFRNEPNYIPSPFFQYYEKWKPKWCQPDGLYFDFTQLTITIVEVKLTHTVRAWWQCRHLYEPVISRAFGTAWNVKSLEVVKYIDYSEPFPEKLLQVDGLKFESEPNLWPVMRWPI